MHTHKISLNQSIIKQKLKLTNDFYLKLFNDTNNNTRIKKCVHVYNTCPTCVVHTYSLAAIPFLSCPKWQYCLHVKERQLVMKPYDRYCHASD